MSSKRLKRSSERIVGGVCGGIAEYFGWDKTMVRVVYAILLFFGIGFLAYIILWIIMPSS